MTLDELLATGRNIELGSHVFGTEEIKEFARKFDPQRFHVDEEAARHSIFGRLCASGWHTASMWMRFNVRHGPEGEALTGGLKPQLTFGPSPGLRHLKWLLPVYSGDTITFMRQVTNHRSIHDRPGWYLVRNHGSAVNQDSVKVMEFESTVLISRI